MADWIGHQKDELAVISTIFSRSLTNKFENFIFANHANAGTLSGTEVWFPSSVSKTLERSLPNQSNGAIIRLITMIKPRHPGINKVHSGNLLSLVINLLRSHASSLVR